MDITSVIHILNFSLLTNLNAASVISNLPNFPQRDKTFE